MSPCAATSFGAVLGADGTWRGTRVPDLLHEGYQPGSPGGVGRLCPTSGRNEKGAQKVQPVPIHQVKGHVIAFCQGIRTVRIQRWLRSQRGSRQATWRSFASFSFRSSWDCTWATDTWVYVMRVSGHGDWTDPISTHIISKWQGRTRAYSNTFGDCDVLHDSATCHQVDQSIHSIHFLHL